MCPRTKTTGDSVWCMTYWAVEPSSSEALDDPAWPTTIVTSPSTSLARSTSARPGFPAINWPRDAGVAALLDGLIEELLGHVLDGQRIDRADGLVAGDHGHVPGVADDDAVVGSGHRLRPVEGGLGMLGSVEADDVRGHAHRPLHNGSAARHIHANSVSGHLAFTGTR